MEKDLSAINPILGTYHEMIMQRECTVEEGIKMMNEETSKNRVMEVCYGKTESSGDVRIS